MNKHNIKFLVGESEISNKKIAFINSSRNAEPHYHYFVEIVYFYKGSGTHIINNKQYPIKSGDLFLINPFTAHSYKTNNDAPVEVYNIIFYTEFLSPTVSPERFIDNLHKEFFDTPYKHDRTKTKFIKLSGDIHHSFLSLFKMIEEEFAKKNEGYLICLKSLLTFLITKIYRYSKTNEQKNSLSLKNKLLLDQAIAYVKNHASEDIKLETLAKKYYFSVCYFNRLLKLHTGMTFGQFLQQERILNATKLLQTTDLSIDEICGKVGYKDIKFFYSIFSKHVGISPAKYRTYIRQENSKN